MDWIELFGYFATALIALSLMMKSIKKLRWINLAGASMFSTYGFIVGAYPVFILNGVITLVDIYHLLRMQKQKDYFTYLPISYDAKYLTKFVEFYLNDIKKYFPNFDSLIFKKNENVLILRNLLPVGIISFHIKNGSLAVIDLDYAIPDYRDLKNAHFLLSGETGFFKDRGVKTLIAEAETESHKWYLKKIGFQVNPVSNNIFMKELLH